MRFRSLFVSVFVFCFCAASAVLAEIRGGTTGSGYTLYLNVPLVKAPAAFLAGSMDDFPVEAEWFTAPLNSSWDGEGNPPSDFEFIREELFSEADMEEGDEFFIYASLRGHVFTEPRSIWMRFTANGGETLFVPFDGFIFAELEGDPPGFDRWFGVDGHYASGYTFQGGTDEAFLIVDTGGHEVTAQFYEGSLGDVSKYLGESRGVQRGPDPGSTMIPFPSFTLSETTTIWARVANIVGTIDTPALTLNVVDLTELPEFVNWYTTVSEVNSGSTIELTAELNLPIAAFDFRWYWGESGDTSEPIEIPSGLIGSNWIYFTVPSEERKFWVRVSAGDTVTDSPTAILRPVALSVPEIIDQPDDLVRIPEAPFMGYQVNLVALGGELNFQWFHGETGDESRLFEGVSGVPGGNGRRAGFMIPFSDESPKAWCKISNSEGSVATRTVSTRLRSFDDLALSFVENTRRYSIRERTQRPGAKSYPDMFAIQTTVPVDAVELYQIVGGEMIFQGREQPASSYLTYPRNAIRWIDTDANPVEVGYTSGTYRVRLYIDEDFIETENLDFVNEILDPDLAQHREVLSLLQTSGSSTMGGLVEAHVMMPTDYLPEAVSILSVVDGAWSETEYEQFYEYYYRPDRSTDPNFYREDILRFRWQPNGSPYYWLIVGRENGSDAVLRLPGNAGGEVVELPESGDPFEVVLPPGVADIPLPKLPANVRWVFGSGDEGGAALELPFEPGDMPRNDVPLKIIDNLSGEPIASAGVRVRIDPDAPPALRDDAPQFVVDANNRLLWSGDVLGDVQRTRLFDISGDTPVELGEWVGRWTVGLPIPDGVTQARIEWDNDGKIQSMEAPVVRLPENFATALGAERVDNDMAYSPELGAFTKLRSYPWAFHGELGWSYLQPRPAGFHFFGLLADGGGGWYWTSADNFPFIYSYRTGGWEYYLMNSYGWVYSYTASAWRKVAL